MTLKKKSIYEPLLLEVAWEVCNKVGGIYTVISSKVPYMIERWGDQYCTVGPCFSEELPIEYQAETDYSDAYGQVVLEMRQMGFEVHYGHWLVAGKPRVILFNVNQALKHIKQIKNDFATYHHVYVKDDELYDQVMAFGYLVTQLFKQLNESKATDKKIIAHIHEWMAAYPLIEIKRLELPISTVFTTHATSLARYMAMNDTNFYNKMASVDWYVEAKKYGIEGQVALERLAAHHCDVMSTVSRVTDIECEYLLGRKSDIILPNGLNIKRFTALHEFQNLHLEFKKKIHEFVMGHFFNNYTFDLDNTLYFFSSGRYEFVNKGYDITLEALSRLNERMKRAKINKTVVMFFITPRPFQTINPLVLQLRSMMEELKQTSEAIQSQIGEKLFYDAAKSEDFNLPDLNKYIDEYWQFRYKKTLQKWKTKYLPIVVTHNLKNDYDDDILNFVRKENFFNQEENPVKLIYHPDFIDSTNPLFKMDYQQFVRGCHLGIFPSYYEPWGYTPVECIARGVPTVTSDLSGFGDYAKNTMKGLDDNGVFVIRRRRQSFDEAAEELTDYLFSFVQQSRRERIAQRNHAESISDNFSWQNLGRHYMEAYRMAMEKME